LLRLLEIAGGCNEERVEVSLEAFSALREMLVMQKDIAAAYINESFDAFFTTYNQLLKTQNYMVQRQALRLLGDLLLDRCFMKVMTSYVGSDDFLKIHMTLLRNRSRALQLEALHVFKLFVGNPRKPVKVQLILFKNQDRIARLLETIALGSYCTETAEELRIVACAVAACRPPRKDAGAA
jgi:calcium binding protein 39